MAYVASFIASMACGTSPDSPLGGPYGGGAYRLGPTDGGFSKVDATFTVPKTTNPAAPAGSPAPGRTSSRCTWRKELSAIALIATPR